MKKTIFSFFVMLFMLGAWSVQGTEPTIFDVNINDLKTFTPLAAGSPVLKADNTPTGMMLYSAAALDATGLRCNGATKRMQISATTGYLELPMLKNPSALSFSSYYTSSTASGRPVIVYKKVKGGEWQVVDTVKPLGGSSVVNCAVYNLNVQTLDSVSLKIVATTNTVCLWNSIKVTGIDMTAPDIAATGAFQPLGNEVPANTSQLFLKFNQAILKNIGTVSLFKTGVGTAIKTFDVATSTDASILQDSTLVLSGVSLNRGASYYVLADAGVVKGKINHVASTTAITNPATWTFTTSNTASSEKEITAFSIPNQDSSKISGTNITAWVKHDANVAQLTCNISLSLAASISSPAGWTAAMPINFSTPQTFIVKAEDETTQSYTVTVVVNKNPDATIKSLIVENSTIKITADTFFVRTLQSLTSVKFTVNAATNSKITIGSTEYADTVTINSLDLSNRLNITVKADNGVNIKTYVVAASSAGEAALPANFKGIDGSGTRWNSIVTTAGWIMNATNSKTDAASGRSPLRLVTSGDCLMLRYDSAASNASYYIRAYNLTTYKVVFLESVNGTQWDTVSITTAGIPAADFIIQQANLKKTSRFVKWVFDNFTGIGGSLMFDELSIAKFVPSSEKAITQFAINSVNGVVNEANKTIAITLPFGTNLTALTPTITISPKATVSPLSGVVQNFTNPVTYTVTAENNSTQPYTVTVTVGKQPVTLSLHDSTYTYNKASHGITASIACGGVTPRPVVNYRYNGLTTKPSKAGTYAVKAWSDLTSVFAFGDTVRATLTISTTQLSVSGMTVSSKEYDGATTATISSWGTLSGVVSGDVVSVSQSGVTASFANKNVGNSKPVTLTTLTLSGADAANYTLVQPTGLQANITSAALTITAGNQTKKKGEVKTLGTSSFTASGLKTGDNVTSVTLTSAGAAASADTGKYSIVPSNAQGTSLSNYTITYANGVLTVTPDQPNAVAHNTLPADMLYPNPASNFAYLDLSTLQGLVNVQLYALNGTLLWQQTLQGGATHQIMLSSLSQGMYIVSINGSPLKLIVK